MCQRQNMLISNGVGALHGRIPNQVPPTLHHARRPGHDGPRHRRQLRRPDLSPAQPLLWDTLSHPPPPWCQPRHETHYRRCPVWSSNATTAALCCTWRLSQDVAPRRCRRTLQVRSNLAAFSGGTGQFIREQKTRWEWTRLADRPPDLLGHPRQSPPPSRNVLRVRWGSDGVELRFGACPDIHDLDAW